MDLWIRTQDKKYIAKVDNVYIEGKNRIFYDCLELGHYKSKQRCLEILDEIQKILMPEIITTPNICEFKITDVPDMCKYVTEVKDSTIIREVNRLVYQMPEE